MSFASTIAVITFPPSIVYRLASGASQDPRTSPPLAVSPPEREPKLTYPGNRLDLWVSAKRPLSWFGLRSTGPCRSIERNRCKRTNLSRKIQESAKSLIEIVARPDFSAYGYAERPKRRSRVERYPEQFAAATAQLGRPGK